MKILLVELEQTSVKLAFCVVQIAHGFAIQREHVCRTLRL